MDYPISYPDIGMRIRQQREHAGLTQEQLSEACGLSASFVGHIERGSRKLSVETLSKIASALNVNTDHLLFGRMTQDASLPSEIASLLQGSDEWRLQQFWRTVKILACHINEL